jgi:hypothetical protein
MPDVPRAPGHRRRRRVAAAVRQFLAIAATPDEHFGAGPHRRSDPGADRCALLRDRSPGISGRILARAVAVHGVQVRTAPDDQRVASPHG